MLKKTKASETPGQAPTIRVLKKFRVIFGSVRQHFADIEQRCGISGSQLWILHEIAQTPGIGISEIANRLSIHQSTCSLLVEKITLRGLAKKIRNPDDQRRIGLHLSVRAKNLLKQAPGPAEGILPDAIKTLSEKQLDSLDQILDLLIRGLKVQDTSFADKPLADL